MRKNVLSYQMNQVAWQHSAIKDAGLIRTLDILKLGVNPLNVYNLNSQKFPLEEWSVSSGHSEGDPVKFEKGIA